MLALLEPPTFLSTQMMYSSGNTYFGLLGGYMGMNSAHIFKMAQKYLSNY